MAEDRDPPSAPESGQSEVPVLQDIVEVRVGPDGQRMLVPLDLDQLTTRIAARLTTQLRKTLHARVEACLDQALEGALEQIHDEVQRLLLEQLASPDE